MSQTAYCVYCFDVLVENLLKTEKAVPPAFPKAPYPLFVTWMKKHTSSSEFVLRGCIGTFTPKKLDVGLREYALISALRDSRFSPIQVKELGSLSCAVSLLTDFEEVSKYNDWEVGTHGITIDFGDSKGNSYSATYLPEVAHEQGWDHDQCVDSLMRKAGYKGTINNALRSSLQVTRYQSSKVTLTYDEYCQLKKGKDEDEEEEEEEEEDS